jgi:hypothetical protein
MRPDARKPVLLVACLLFNIAALAHSLPTL